jgi:hypothetical protein
MVKCRCGGTNEACNFCGGRGVVPTLASTQFGGVKDGPANWRPGAGCCSRVVERTAVLVNRPSRRKDVLPRRRVREVHCRNCSVRFHWRKGPKNCLGCTARAIAMNTQRPYRDVYDELNALTRQKYKSERVRKKHAVQPRTRRGFRQQQTKERG